MGGPQGEMDWLTGAWTEDVGDYIRDVMAGVDTMVLGRKLAEGFIPHWLAQPEDEPQDAIDFMNETPKVVFSRTLDVSPWENTVVASDVVQTITDLKSQPGGDLIVYGGATVMSSLVRAELVDELHMLVNPTAIGAGLALFGSGTERLRFNRVKATPFECGITAIHLEPLRA
jgi:dihydrofolate reductase